MLERDLLLMAGESLEHGMLRGLLIFHRQSANPPWLGMLWKFFEQKVAKIAKAGDVVFETVSS